jgi:DNA processing protein
MDELLAVLALAHIPGIPPRKKKEMALGSASVASLFDDPGRVSEPRVRSRIRAFDGFRGIEKDLASLREMKARVITIRDASYPAPLREIPDAPIVLYARGPLSCENRMMAIVGSRKATLEGMNLAERIAETLASMGITVVSGFARGIDSAAHRGAMKGKGKTVAVLGCGIDICYPAENKHLYERINGEGLMVTEYPPNTRPLPVNFPARNRIIAGLSRGVLVIEASAKSGSLITARLALDYNREVLAVPGRVFDEEYKGANNLIKQGAKLVEDMEDILASCFPDLEVKKPERLAMADDEEYIYGLMGLDKVHVDDLAGRSRLEMKFLMPLLTRLEMKDLVRSLPGGFYIRKV